MKIVHHIQMAHLYLKKFTNQKTRTISVLHVNYSVALSEFSRGIGFQCCRGKKSTVVDCGCLASF